MSKKFKGRNGKILAASTPLPKPVTLHDRDGEVIPGIAPSSEYLFSRRQPNDDEAVYTIFEAFAGPKELGLTFWVKPGVVMCTAKVGGGAPDDSMLVFLRGQTPPPEGTRFAVRMLGPAVPGEGTYSVEGTYGAEIPEDQGGESPQDAQGDVGVQRPQLALVEREKGDEPEAGHRDRALGERAVQEETPSKAALIQRFKADLANAKKIINGRVDHVKLPMSVVDFLLENL